MAKHPKKIVRLIIAIAATSQSPLAFSSNQMGNPLGDTPWLPIESLNPYLKYPALELLQTGSVEPYGPQVGIMAVTLDPLHRGRQIFLSNFCFPSGLFGFEGASGSPIFGFSPASGAGAYAGPVLPTAIAASGGQVDNPQDLPLMSAHMIFEMHSTGGGPDYTTTRLLDGHGDTLWSSPLSNPTGGPYPSPATSYGILAADGSSDALFLIDEENFSSHGRSARTSAVVWDSPNAFDQQIMSPALIDVEGGHPDAAFVFCRGRGACLLEKHRVKDGSLLWQSFIGSNHIYPFVAVGDVDGKPGDEVVVIARQDHAPANALVRVIDGNTGDLKWEFDLGEPASWGPAPVLADIDGDGVAEILVQTNQMLHLVRFGVGEAANWPVATSTLGTLPVRAEPVVGDLDGDGVAEIAVISNDYFVGYLGHLDIFDANGYRKFFSKTVLMTIGSGVTPAIADIDDDGHNELIFGTSVSSSVVGGAWLPSVWVLDFSRDSASRDGAILWGQFGGNAEHTARALSPKPKVGVAPAMLASSLLPASSKAERMAIGNEGAADLSWMVAAESVPASSEQQAGDQVTWLHFSESNGTLAGGHEHIVDITVDSTGLDVGAYDASIRLTTNDSRNPQLRVPVHLDVVSTAHAISLAGSAGGSVVPALPDAVADGAVMRFLATPRPGRFITALSGCGGTVVGSELTTAPIRSDCTIFVSYSDPFDLLFSNGFEADE